MHNPPVTWTQHFRSQQLVDHLDIQPHKALLQWTDHVSFRECPVAAQTLAHLKQNSPQRFWHLRPVSRDAFALVDTKKSELLDPLSFKIIVLLNILQLIQLSDVFNLNHPTCAVQFLHPEIQLGPGCGTFFLDVFFCLCLSLYLLASCDLALSPLSLSIHERICAAFLVVECSLSSNV